jgi:hypothetical protein
VQDNSQADLDVLGDAELGKSVISYYRGVRGTMKGVRDLAASYQKHRAVSDIAQRLRESLIAGQAGSAECAREAKMLAERIRPTMKQP